MANIFSRSFNRVPVYLLISLGLLALLVIAGVSYYATPEYTRVGYTPEQPVPYDHSLHVTQLGLDCRYCHTFVDQSGHANIPDAGTCMNCHNVIKPDSPLLAPVRDSFNTGKAIPWVRVHKVPDYVYFNHAVHVNRGVSCVECHGNVNHMKTVGQKKSLNMSFCLDCHRNPETRLRPLDKVYDLDWTAASEQEQLRIGKDLVEHMQINPPESCSGCHR